MEHQKKILYVITKASFGGAQRYICDLAPYAAQRGFEVVVAYGKNEFGGESVFERKLKSDNIRTISIVSLGRDINIFDDAKVFFELIALFRREQPHVVHLNSSKIGGLGAVAARIACVRKIVFTAHGLPHNEPRPYWQKMVIRVGTWLTFIFAHNVIVIAQSELAEVTHWWGIQRKLTRIYNGVGLYHGLTRDEARAKLEQLSGLHLQGKIVLGGIAELTRNKGLAGFLEALEQLKKNHPDFIYVHFGVGELSEQLKALTDKFGLGEHVRWLGFDKEARNYVSAFDIFTLPSLKEGLSYTLLEAGSAGVAVAVSAVGGMPEIVIHEETGLTFSPGDVEEIVASLEKLINNEDLRNKYGEAIQARVRGKFSIDAMLQETLALYESQD